MGVDACIDFTTEKPLGKVQLHTLDYMLCCAMRAGQPDSILSARRPDPDNPHPYRHQGVRAIAGDPDGVHYSINLICRYYGPGYERGPWPDIAAVLEFLRRRLPPNSTVYYYGDSGGPEDGLIIKSFGSNGDHNAQELNGIWSHWSYHNTLPYNRGWFRDTTTVPSCGWCEEPLIIYGIGPGSSVSYWCPGCFMHAEGTRNTTELHILTDEERKSRFL